MTGVQTCALPICRKQISGGRFEREERPSLARSLNKLMKGVKRFTVNKNVFQIRRIVLAATLLKIKSEMILPRPEKSQEGNNLEDPREQLVEKIIEYKKAKYCAELLDESFQENLKVYTKPAEDISQYVENPKEYLNLEMPAFIKAFQEFLGRKQRDRKSVV